MWSPVVEFDSGSRYHYLRHQTSGDFESVARPNVSAFHGDRVLCHSQNID